MKKLARTIVVGTSAAVLILSGQQSASAVGPLPTTVTLSVDSTAISAIVGWQGLLPATGTVKFFVGKRKVGTKALPSPAQPTDMTVTVTLKHHVPPGRTRIIRAVYSGDMSYATSKDKLVRRDPTMTRTIKSKAPKTKYGWYRTSVLVVFHCTPHGSRTKCPSPLHFRHSGRDQRGSATTTAANGGSTTVRVKHINIDKHKPKLSVIRSGSKLRCRATDPLSGVASCKIHRKAGTYHAVARDKAGNRTVVSGRI